jgi:hypothetical protein
VELESSVVPLEDDDESDPPVVPDVSVPPVVPPLVEDEPVLDGSVVMVPEDGSDDPVLPGVDELSV